MNALIVQAQRDILLAMALQNMSSSRLGSHGAPANLPKKSMIVISSCRDHAHAVAIKTTNNSKSNKTSSCLTWQASDNVRHTSVLNFTESILCPHRRILASAHGIMIRFISKWSSSGCIGGR
eukprot:jgi/Botrbrau1/1612/Bobra.0185s0027.1